MAKNINKFKDIYITEQGGGMFELLKEYWKGARDVEHREAYRLYAQYQSGINGNTWTIYQITEFGKVVYIGLTGKKPSVRWSHHKSSARTLDGAAPLHRAMNEISSDHKHFPAYRFSILHQTTDKAAAEALEIAEIAAHGTNVDGYNIYMGGGNTSKKYGKENP